MNRRTVEFLNSESEDLTYWSPWRKGPTCRLMEHYYDEMLSSKPEIRPDGLFLTGTDVPVAGLYKATIRGLNNWVDDAPNTVDLVILLKNPTSSLQVRRGLGFGRRNGILEYEGLLFAAKVIKPGLHITRPVRQSWQERLQGDLHSILSGIDRDSIPNL